jgi:predicted DCC family thiol-disulfide oxidoreductase YuxK
MGLEHHADKSGGTMVVLRESDGAIFTSSDAWLEVSRALGGPWRLFLIFKLVPRFIRDAAYRVFARNRYRWFGKTSTCRMPE